MVGGKPRRCCWVSRMSVEIHSNKELLLEKDKMLIV